MRASAIAVLLAAGCSAPTSLLVHLDLDPGFVPTVQAAEVALAGRGMVSQALDPATRAFTVLLPDAALDVTVRVSDTDAGGHRSSGMLSVRSVPRQRVERTLCLGAHCAVADLGALDLAGADLAGADLAGPDMTLSPCGGPSRCPGAGVALCEGFDDGVVPAPWGKRVDPGASLAFDGTIVCRGNKSLHLTTPAISTAQQIASYVYESQVLPSTTFFLRAFLYAPAQPFPDPQMTVLQAFQTQSPFYSDTVNVQMNALKAVAGCGTYNETPAAARQPFPTGRWVCAEWEIVSGTGTAGAEHFWLDGVPSTIDLANVSTQSSPALGAVAVGIDFVPAASASQVDLWVDEIAIDTARIGCVR